VVLKLFVAADPFHCTQNFYRHLRFVNFLSIIEKLDFVASYREHLNRSHRKQVSCFGLPPIDANKIKQKGQSTCNMNMSGYRCGAIKLNNGTNGRMKTSGFS